MTITIRPYHTEDFAACEAMCQQEESFFNQYLRSIVAVESSSNRVVGCCSFRDQRSRRPLLWDIQRIVVARDARRQGVARQLLQAVVDLLPPGLQLELIVSETRLDVIAFCWRCGIPFVRESASGLRRFSFTKPSAGEPKPC